MVEENIETPVSTAAQTSPEHHSGSSTSILGRVQKDLVKVIRGIISPDPDASRATGIFPDVIKPEVEQPDGEPENTNKTA